MVQLDEFVESSRLAGGYSLCESQIVQSLVLFLSPIYNHKNRTRFKVYLSHSWIISPLTSVNRKSRP